MRLPDQALEYMAERDGLPNSGALPGARGGAAAQQHLLVHGPLQRRRGPLCAPPPTFVSRASFPSLAVLGRWCSAEPARYLQQPCMPLWSLVCRPCRMHA